MKLLSPAGWNVAWRLRAGLFVVPLLLIILGLFQFFVSNAIALAYRDIFKSLGVVLTNAYTIMQEAEEIAASVHRQPGQPAGSQTSEKHWQRIEQLYSECLPHADQGSRLRRDLQVLDHALSDWRSALSQDRGQQDRQLRAQIEAKFAAVRAADRALRAHGLEQRDHDLARANGLLRAANIGTLVFDCAAVLLALKIAMALVSLVIKPLEQITEQSRRIGQGDYRPLPVPYADEYGEVMHTMNGMSLAIQSRLESERAISRVSMAITRSLDINVILETAGRELGTALEAARCFIVLSKMPDRTGPDDDLPLRSYQWLAPGVEGLSEQSLTSHPLVLLAMEDGLTVACADVAGDDRFAAHSQPVVAAGVAASMATPLWLRGTVIGVIGVDRTGPPTTWQANDVNLLEVIAGHMAIKLQNARLLYHSRLRERELQEAQDALTASSRQLAEKNRELEAFVYTVSHDLQAPLISIQGYLAAMHDEFGGTLQPAAQLYLERVASNASHLQSLISELMDLSRVGTVVEPVELVDLEEMAQEIRASLLPQAQARGVQVEIVGRLPVLATERKRMRQVLGNLMENAIKYCDPAKTSRWARVSCQEEFDCWHVCVVDNGIGIALHHLEKCFAIFHRLHKSPEPGSGIGLSIVRRAAEVLGGRAWAESAGEGEGAAFHFTIPKVTTAADSPE